MVRGEDAVLSRYLLRERAVGVGDVVSCAEAQRDARAAGQAVPHLWELLLARGLIAADVLQAARQALAEKPQPAPRQARAARRRGPKRRFGDSSGFWRPGWSNLEQDGTAPGDRLGQYEVLAPVARGSMGAVFAARDTRSGAKVALKVLAGERAERDTGPARFRREAQLLCSLHHEGLVRGLAFGSDAGRAFLVMEYVDGPSLKHMVRQRGEGLEERRALEIGIGLAEALGYLHRRGIVHRDVKPANVLVDARGRARLCDLGLAREFRGLSLTDRVPRSQVRPEGLSEATATHDTLGTPSYMSPEQARGARVVGPPADLYSLGITLFYALAGRPPFLDESGIIVLTRHIVCELPDLRRLRPGVSPRLAEVVQRLTRKDPEERFGSAQEAAAAMESLLPATARRAA